MLIFPTIFQTLAAEALAISMKAPMGNARVCCRRATGAAQGRERESVLFGEDCRVDGGDDGDQTSSISKCAGTGHSFLSALLSSNTKRTYVLCFSKSSLSVRSL